MSGSDRRGPLLRIRRRDWKMLVREIGRRGHGSREAGAFLLARIDGDRRSVEKIVYFDDIDPGCLQGGIVFDGRTFSRLWDICEFERSTVVADLHSHPGRSVQLSSVDAENPMIGVRGFLSLIVPFFATRKVRIAEVGVHEYLGDDGWSSYYGRDASRVLRWRRWR